MKKIFIAAILALAMLVGCNPEAKVLEQAKVDYATAVADAPEEANVCLYEIEMVLDNPVSDLKEGKKVKLQSSTTVIQIDTMVRFINRTYDSKGKIVSENVVEEAGAWLEDMNIPLDSLNYDLPDALQALAEFDEALPEGDKVTLRAPLVPPFKDTYYIFGTMGTFFVSVNAVSGEIEMFREVEEVEEKEEVSE